MLHQGTVIPWGGVCALAIIGTGRTCTMDVILLMLHQGTVVPWGVACALAIIGTGRTRKFDVILLI